MTNELKIADFPQANVKIAEDQEEYLTLPAHVGDGRVTFCWELTDEQIEELKSTKKIWQTVWTFGGSLQPVSAYINNPFDNE